MSPSMPSAAAELGLASKRDVSFGARSPVGIRAWDRLHTILGTATKLGVNVLHYLRDRFTGTYGLPALADQVRQRAPIRPAVCTTPSLVGHSLIPTSFGADTWPRHMPTTIP